MRESKERVNDVGIEMQEVENEHVIKTDDYEQVKHSDVVIKMIIVAVVIVNYFKVYVMDLDLETNYDKIFIIDPKVHEDILRMILVNNFAMEVVVHATNKEVVVVVVQLVIIEIDTMLETESEVMASNDVDAIYHKVTEILIVCKLGEDYAEQDVPVNVVVQAFLLVTVVQHVVIIAVVETVVKEDDLLR